MNDDELDELFHSLPREISPPGTTWPSVEGRIKTRHSPWSSRLAVGIAAAMLFFVAGVGVGRATGGGGTNAAPDRAAPRETRTNDAFVAAIRVQETATAYLGALAALPGFEADSSQPGGAFEQGREVARGTLVIARRATAGL